METGDRNSRLALTWKIFSRNRAAIVGAVILIVLYGSAIFAPWIAPYEPNATGLDNILAPPSRQHLMGTDLLGRDLLSRILFGSRISLLIGAVAATLMIFLGVTIGAVSGYYGGLIDNFLMRFTDVVICFPSFFLILMLVALVGPSITNIIVVIGVTRWTHVARLVRGEFLSLRERDFVQSARAVGAMPGRIMSRHLLPNAIGPIIVAATFGVATAILTESALSYLGVGVRPPDATWGNILHTGKAYLRTGPWLTMFPGTMIVITVLALNFVGDGLRDAFDPKAINK